MSFIGRKIMFTILRFSLLFLSTVVTPGLLQKMSIKCNSAGEFPGSVVFLDVLFQKVGKKSQNVTVRESLL